VEGAFSDVQPNRKPLIPAQSRTRSRPVQSSFDTVKWAFWNSFLAMPTLDWIGKSAVVDHHRKVPYHLLRCDRELSAGDADAGNLLVQGDNLLALKALLPYYAGKIKCIYIDPPYNTGNEGWVYNDNVNSPEIRKWLAQAVGKEGEDLSRHDKWLCMMYPRLALLKEFLAEDGVIFVSIDDNEVHHLRAVMDEIFGAKNFIASFVWQKRRSPDNDEKFTTNVHDYIICYANYIEKCSLNRFPRTEESNARYSNPDNDPRGPWTSSDLTRREYRAHDYYEIALPSGRKVKPAAGRSWNVPPSSFEALRQDNRLWFGADGNNMPRRKRFLSEVSTGLVPMTWWNSENFSDNQTAKREVRHIFSDVDDLFATPKPRRLISRILEIATNKDSLVMDSFAGSGTTAHAVLAQNAADGGNRRFILVEMDENICRNVTAQRVRKAVDGYNNTPGLGGGFRYCKMGAGLFDEMGNISSEVRFADLAAHVYFTETGVPLPKRTNGAKSPLLGAHRGRAVYLLYNGILGDRSVSGGNVLTHEIAAALPPHDGLRVVYGEACRLGKKSLERYNITFRQVPYELKVD